jgi:hypothetical protein
MNRRLRIVLSVLAAAALAVVVLGAVYMLAPQAPPPDLSLTKLSQKGLFRIALDPEPELLTVGPIHNWTVTVTSPDGTPVTGARFAIDGGMPAHHHGLPTSPQVTDELGEGRYRIEGVKFSMGGLWVLKITVTAATGSDEASFNLQI